MEDWTGFLAYSALLFLGLYAWGQLSQSINYKTDLLAARIDRLEGRVERADQDPLETD